VIQVTAKGFVKKDIRDLNYGAQYDKLAPKSPNSLDECLGKV